MQKIILDREGLQRELRLKGWTGKWISRLLYSVLELEKINTLNARYCHLEGPEFAAQVLEAVGVTYDLPAHQLDHIPAEGGFITVSNHPIGSLDGLILTKVVGGKRADYKILTTFLLAMIPSLRSRFIPVNNLSTGDTRTVSGIRAALGHIAEGKPLGLFPAGEVSTWQKGEKRTAPGKEKVVEDAPWADNMMKLIRRSGLPVIPIYFTGSNSKTFHWLGRIHPRLRTVRLPHEMLNKKGTNLSVRIGEPILPEEMAGLSDKELAKFLRGRCYALEAQCKESSKE
ncbi:MAG: lysophospholipid acyltransferase family protein [Bacteroidales bacterium]|nr:lysophospholipid acyltransferase family protein [Bacteroidales bacterium]